MRVGSIVFATDQGLGYLAKDFFDNGLLTDVLVLRHGQRREHDEWFPGQPRIGSLSQLRDSMDVANWMTKMDAMLFLETPFDWNALSLYKSMGVKTALMPMHECEPDPLPATPDLFINPSALEQQIYGGGIHIPVPVPSHIQWRKRGIAQTFVHNAGNGGLAGRNGTKQLLEAWRLVRSPAKLIVRMQEPPPGLCAIDPRIEIITGTVHAEQLYDRGEVFVFPEMFNGLSLPLQEACASGMAVMATDRFPTNTWLPHEPLIPCHTHIRSRLAGRLRWFDQAVLDVLDIASTIDAWYGKDVGHLSEQGRLWALQNSWQELKPMYLKALSELCNR